MYRQCIDNVSTLFFEECLFSLQVIVALTFSTFTRVEQFLFFKCSTWNTLFPPMTFSIHCPDILRQCSDIVHTLYLANHNILTVIVLTVIDRMSLLPTCHCSQHVIVAINKLFRHSDTNNILLLTLIVRKYHC
jgi:hypothetical protein